MKKAQIISSFVGGALAVVVISATVIGFSTNNKKNVPTTTNSTTTRPVSEETTATEITTIPPVVTTITQSPPKNTTSSHKSQTNIHNQLTKAPRSQEEWDEEYKSAVRVLNSSHESKIAQLKARLATPPRALRENASEWEIELYNEEMNDYEKRLEQYNIDMAEEEIKYRNNLEEAKVECHQ